MRITSFPLNLRAGSLHSQPKPLSLSDKDTDQTKVKSKWLTAEGPLGYVSLLGNEPYTPSPSLSRPSGLPSNPRLSLPPSSSGPMNSDFKLTPDTLRYIGKTVAEFSSQIRGIQLAYLAAHTRAGVQKQELARMSAKSREMQALVERLRGPGLTASQARWEAVQNEQKALLRRLDRMLQALMEKASPELSEHETKWFEELKRMKEEISGSGRYDEGSLVARTRLVCLIFLDLTTAFIKSYLVGKRVCTFDA
jgi:nucleoporin NUP82